MVPPLVQDAADRLQRQQHRVLVDQALVAATEAEDGLLAGRDDLADHGPDDGVRHWAVPTASQDPDTHLTAALDSQCSCLAQQSTLLPLRASWSWCCPAFWTG